MIVGSRLWAFGSGHLPVLPWMGHQLREIYPEQTPRDESQESRAESREARVESQEPRAESQEPRA